MFIFMITHLDNEFWNEELRFRNGTTNGRWESKLPFHPPALGQRSVTGKSM